MQQKYIEGALSGLKQRLETESRSNLRKNAFYFSLKVIFVLKIFKFLSWILVMYKNSLIRKIRLISKLMMSQPGKQTIATHTLLNNSRSKDNQTIKLCQLIEYDVRNIFLEKSYIKWVGETILRPLHKRIKFTIYMDLYLPKVLYSLFLLYSKLWATKIYWN